MNNYFQAECTLVDHIDAKSLAQGKLHRLGLDISFDAMGNKVRLPVLVVRGTRPGPVFGVTAVMHGDELNGIRVIHRLVQRLKLSNLCGTVVGCPIINVPAFMRRTRLMHEGFDLNRIMPGRADGNVAEQYAHNVFTRLIVGLDYLVDLHTASFGRENSLYVRANMNHTVAAKMARLQHPEIIVHNEAADGTLRGAAMDYGIPSITVEVGNPHRFQKSMIKDSLLGVMHVLDDLGMLASADLPPLEEPVLCKRSYWLYATQGGLLEVVPPVTDRVKKGETIARVSNVFGQVIATHVAPEDGIIVGRSTSPVCESGSRIVHLGVG